MHPSRLRRALGGAAIAAVLLLGAGGLAAAGTTKVSSDEQAVAALDRARAEIDAVRSYVAGKPSTPPSTPAPPPPGDQQTAAGRLGWGTPVAAGSDEFNYAGAPDPARWSTYNGPGHAGNGRRVASASTVQDGFLRQTGKANGDTAGMASKFGQRFGRWEVRARVNSTGASGKPYHAVLITWPDSDQWPAGAEYDFFEVNVGDTCAAAFLHLPNHQPYRQESARKCPVDLTAWHNYGFSWRDNLLVGYIDGQEWFRFTGRVAQAPGPMHQTIQLDNFFGSGMQPATFDIDWARAYRPAP